MDDEKVPIAMEGVDYATLKSQPTAQEFFVLSRLDGKLTVGELCKISGLGVEHTKSALLRLNALGLIRTAGDGAGLSVKNISTKKNKLPDYSRLPISLEDYSYPADMLSLDVDIDDARKKEILCVHGQLDTMTYYQLFGLDQTADRKAIRNAYFKLSKRFHPDLFFRRDLKAFGPLVERVFQYIVKAHDTLSHPQKRFDYDTYLKELYQRVRQFSPTTRLPAINRHDGTSNHASSTSGANKPATSSATISDISQATSSFQSLVEQANCSAEAGDAIQAAKLYHSALKIQLDAGVALEAATVLLNASCKLEQAAMFAKVALQIDPVNIEAMLLLGDIYRAQQDSQRAANWWQKVLEQVPGHNVALRRLELLGQ